jgi:hypothetical protein
MNRKNDMTGGTAAQVFRPCRTTLCSGTKITHLAVRFERIPNQIRDCRRDGFGTVKPFRRVLQHSSGFVPYRYDSLRVRVVRLQFEYTGMYSYHFSALQSAAFLGRCRGKARAWWGATEAFSAENQRNYLSFKDNNCNVFGTSILRTNPAATWCRASRTIFRECKQGITGG